MLDELAAGREVTWNPKHSEFRTTCPICSKTATVRILLGAAFATCESKCNPLKIKTALEESKPPVAAEPQNNLPATSKSLQKNGHHKNGNGKPDTAIVNWTDRLYRLMKDVDEGDPGFFKQDRDSLLLQILRAVDTGVVWKPTGLSKSDVEEEVDRALTNYLAVREELLPAVAGEKPRAEVARSEYDLNAQPALSSLRVMDADEFFDHTSHLDHIEWLWEDIAPSNGIIGVFGDPEAGKSTFSRTLALGMSRGDPVLGRKTLESTVLYLDLADEQLSHRRAFQKLGWARGKLKIVSQDSLIGVPNNLELVENAVKQLGAKMVVVDMMADLLQFRDLNDYANAKAALRGLRVLSRRTAALYVVLHHTPKALGPDADVLKAGLGSQAIVGAFDLRMAIRRRDKQLSTILMSSGKIGGSPLTTEYTLVCNPDTEWIELGQEWGRARADYYLAHVVAYLKENAGQEMGASKIAEELALNPGWIRGSLALASKKNLIRRSGEGRRGKPFAYAWPPLGGDATEDSRVQKEREFDEWPEPERKPGQVWSPPGKPEPVDELDENGLPKGD